MLIKKCAAWLISAVMLVQMPWADAYAEENAEEEQKYTQSYVLMEVTTQTAVRERDGRERVRMGSLNKLMTVLLAAEAVERGEITLETELICSEHSNSMQGAQIWLMPGEKMKLEDLLKAVIIGNANDAACVIAEKIGGTEEKFAELMNRRAAELGMNDTFFTNSTGYYDDDKQYTTAYDAALLLCELSKHDFLRGIFTTRLDELKGGEVQLVTTNSMGHRYKGSIGFKCGAGASSGYFAAEGAEREGLTYVAAVMDCEEEDTALGLAKELLDIGFGGYTVVKLPVPEDMPMQTNVYQGMSGAVKIAAEDSGYAVIPKGRENDIEVRTFIPSAVYAPVESGEKIGEYRIFMGERLIKVCSINASEAADKKDLLSVLINMLKCAVRF